MPKQFEIINDSNVLDIVEKAAFKRASIIKRMFNTCLLYTSDAADERSSVDLGGRRIIKKKQKPPSSFN